MNNQQDGFNGDEQERLKKVKNIRDSVLWIFAAMMFHFLALNIGSFIAVFIYMLKDLSSGDLAVVMAENGVGQLLYKGIYDYYSEEFAARYIYEPTNLATIIAVPLIILGLFVLCKVTKADFGKQLALKKFEAGRSSLGFMIGFTVYMPIAMIVAYTFIGDLSPDTTEMFNMIYENTPFILLFLSTAVCAPIVEEFTFRGFIQTKLESMTKPWAAIVIQAVLFGAFHMNLQQFFYATLLGLLFGLMRYWAKSVWPVIFAHIGFNMFSTVFSEVMSHEEWAITQTIGSVPDIILALISIALFASAFWGYETISRKKAEESGTTL